MENFKQLMIRKAGMSGWPQTLVLSKKNPTLNAIDKAQKPIMYFIEKLNASSSSLETQHSKY